MKINIWIKCLYKKIIKIYIKKKKNVILIRSLNFKKEIENLIWNIANWIICNNKKYTKYCNRCKSCFLMKYKNHPDYLIIKSKKIDIKNIISIEKFYSKSSQQSKFKVIFINEISNLTKRAYILILKILEEIKNNVFFIMTTFKNNISKIKNRFLILNFYPPKENKIIKWLKIKSKLKYKKENYLSAIRNTYNFPYKSLKFIKKKNWFERIYFYKKLVKNIKENKILKLFTLLSKRNIKLLINLLLDSLKWQKKEYNILINVDNKKIIKEISKHLNSKKLYKCLKLWIKYLKIIKIFNFNKDLLIIKNLLKWNILIKKDKIR